MQAIFYASYVGFGIPSDETYHFGSIQYYADQPVTTGPFTHDQNPDSLPIVRAIDRNPNYFFHYLLSWPERLMQSIGMSHQSEVSVLRLIDVAFAILALYIFKKCLDEISDDKVVKNFTVFAVTTTGMAVWLAGAINYDNLANLFFISFVWTALRITKKPTALLILSALTLAMATTITKYVFVPVLGIGLVTLLVFLQQKRYGPSLFMTQLRKSFQVRKALTVIIVFLTILFGGLFIERIGVNLLRYRSVQPECTEFFTVNECRTYNVFNRDYKQKLIYDEEGKASLIKNTDPFSFAGEWIYGMYNTLYFQLGDRRFESGSLNQVFAFLLTSALAVTAVLSRKRLGLNKAASLTLLISASYVLILFLYNLNTYISIGRKYAYQGRYLLPVIGFLYFFTIMMVVNTYRNRKPTRRYAFVISWAIVLLLFFATHFPPLLLAKETDASWRQEFILPPEIVD